jgi:hypothetical protein
MSALCTSAYGCIVVVLVEAFSLLVLNFVVESCCCRVASYSSSMLLLLHARTHQNKKKKNFAPVTRMVVVTRRFVTYGIRAGSTRDLGFTTGSVDMMVLIILLLIELFACVQVIMVRGRRGGRRRGARGGGATPPAASTPEGSNPQGGEQVLGQEQIAVADVVGMMRSFQRMSEALISRLDRDEARAPAPAEVPPRAPAVTGSIHRELEKVKFPEFFGAPDGAAAEAWLENMAMCFALRDYTSNMKVRMAVFQLKGSALLWWKTLLPQLNMAVEDVSWELFEERFRERYLSEEFIERQLNEFNALRQGGRTVPEYEARFMELLRYAPHLNTEKLKVNRFVFGLNGSLRAKVRILMPQTLHDAVQKALIAEEELISGGQTRTPSRPSRAGFIWYTAAADTSETYAGISWFPEGIHVHYASTTAASAADTLPRTTAAAAASPAAAV